MEHDGESLAPIAAEVCPDCGGDVAPSLLSCPTCHRLVHSDRLKELAGTAEALERAGDLSAAHGAWQEAIALLPPDARQYAIVGSRIAALSRRIEAGRPAGLAAAPTRPGTETLPVNPHDHSRGWGGAVTGVAGTVALAFWKFKFAAIFLLTKAKFLLLGLTKASTFLSMLATFGLYFAAFGPWFALGLVLSIYVHEMGHVAALMRYGVPASAPLFLPGFGAVVRGKMAFAEPRLNARVALAGPVWGCGGALACAGLYVMTDQPLWGAIARMGAWLNLVNLAPVWILDGAKVFATFNRPQRWLAVTAIATSWAVTADPLVLVMMLVAAYQAAAGKPAEEPDNGALFQYVATVAVLSALWLLPVHVRGF